MLLRACLVLTLCALPLAAAGPAAAPAPVVVPAAVPAVVPAVVPAAVPAGVHPAAPVDLAALLPDHAVALLGTRNWEELSADVRASAYGRLLADEAFAPLCAAAVQAWSALGDETRADLGFDPFSFAGMLSGPVAFALLDASGSPGYEPGTFPLVAALLVDVGERRADMSALLDDMLDKAAEAGDVVLLNDDLDGEVVTTLLLGSGDEEGDGFAKVGLHGDVLLLVSGEQGLEDQFDAAWDALDGEAQRLLADAPVWRAVPDQWEGDGVLLWADTERILEAVREGDADGELFGAPDVLRALGMLEALGVTTIGPVTQTLVMDGAGTRALFSVPWDGETVLGRAASAVMRPRRPELLQLASPKVYAAVALNVDWTAAFDEGVDLAVEFGGMELADVAATMAELDAGLGFSLRDELLVNLDGRLGVFSVEVEPAEAFTLAGPTPVPMNFVLVLGLSDGEAMRTLVDTAVDASPMRAALTREDFQGFDVHRLPAGMPGLTLFWALTDDVLVASLAPTPVHDVLRRKLSGELPSLAADEQVAAALARLPADASVLRLEKGATSFRGIFDQLSMVAQLGRADMPEAVIGPLLEAMAGLGDLDPAILEKYLDRPTVEAWRIGESGIRGEVLGP